MKPGLRPREVKILQKLLEKLPSLPNITQELFISVMSKNVPITAELAILRDGAVLLTYRSDAHYTGRHFPGSFISPGETFEETNQRVAQKEVGLTISRSKLLDVLNVPNDVRFHYVSLVFLCNPAGEPTAGKWSSQCPPDIIPKHRAIWNLIEPYLRGKAAF